MIFKNEIWIYHIPVEEVKRDFYCLKFIFKCNSPSVCTNLIQSSIPWLKSELPILSLKPCTLFLTFSALLGMFLKVETGTKSGEYNGWDGKSKCYLLIFAAITFVWSHALSWWKMVQEQIPDIIFSVNGTVHMRKITVSSVIIIVSFAVYSAGSKYRL